MSTSKWLNDKDLALLLLRLGVGVIFIVAGWGKINGIDGTAGFFGNVGIPIPGVMAWVVAIVEFVGGIMVLTGFKIRIPTLLLAVVMTVAIITTKLGGENVFQSMRLDLMLLLTNLALSVMGSGKYSLNLKAGKSGS